MNIFEEYPYVTIMDVIGSFLMFGLPFYCFAYFISHFFKAQQKVFICLSLLLSLTYFGFDFELVYRKCTYLREWDWDRVADDLPHLINGIFTVLCAPFVLSKSRFLFKSESIGNNFKQ